MKRLLIMLLGLFVSVSLSFGFSSEPFGNSYLKTSTGGLITGYWDWLQCTEDMYKLGKGGVVNLNGSSLSLGGSYKINSLIPIFLLDYRPSTSYSDNNTINVGVNQTISANDSKNNPSSDSDSSSISGGFGLQYNFLGIKVGTILVINKDNANTKTASTNNTIQKTNSTELYKKSDNISYAKTDSGTLSFLYETGGKIGIFAPQLQLKFSINNGTIDDNVSYSKTVTYKQSVASNIVINENITDSKGMGAFNSANILYLNYNRLRSFGISIMPDVKIFLNKVITAYIGGSFDILSLSKDDAQYESVNTVTSYYSTGVNYGKKQSETITTDLYEYSQDVYTSFGVYTALKYKKSISKNIIIGIYPKYGFTYFKAGYTVNHTKTTVAKNDANNNGVFESTEITETIQSGDIDSFEYSEIGHTLSLPIGLKWDISSIISMRFGDIIGFQYKTTTLKKSDTSGFTTQSVNGTSSSLATSESTSEENTSNFSVNGKSLYLGFGISIMDNMVLDLLANSTTSFAISSFRGSLTYLF